MCGKCLICWFWDFFLNIPLYVLFHLHVSFDWFFFFKPIFRKNSAFAAAFQIQNYRVKKLPNADFSKITLPEKPLKVLLTNGHISKCRRSMNLSLVPYYCWKCAPYNDRKNSFFLKCHLFPVLWDCLACLFRPLCEIVGDYHSLRK